MRVRLLYPVICLFIWWNVSTPAHDPPKVQVTVLRVGKLLDPETGKSVSDQIIVVEGKKIRAIGANVSIPPMRPEESMSRRSVSK